MNDSPRRDIVIDALAIAENEAARLEVRERSARFFATLRVNPRWVLTWEIAQSFDRPNVTLARLELHGIRAGSTLAGAVAKLAPAVLCGFRYQDRDVLGVFAEWEQVTAPAVPPLTAWRCTESVLNRWIDAFSREPSAAHTPASASPRERPSVRLAQHVRRSALAALDRVRAGLGGQR